MEKGNAEKNIPVMFLLKSLLFSYIVTAVLLLVLTLLLYKVGLSEKFVSIAIIAIYVVATFFAGFITGKKMQSRKFLWGLLIGCVYFGVLLLVSVLANQESGEMGKNVVTTFILCAAGGMLGGMLS